MGAVRQGAMLLIHFPELYFMYLVGQGRKCVSVEMLEQSEATPALVRQAGVVREQPGSWCWLFEMQRYYV